jgi:hypothetical protein
MVTMATTDEHVETAIAVLRQAGHEAEARAVEALLTERRPARRRQPTPDDFADLVPIAEAARLIGASRKGVLRRIEHGALTGELNPEHGHQYVTRRSLDRLRDDVRRSEIIARPLLPDEPDEWDTSSNIGHIFAESIRELARLEQAEMEEEREEREAPQQTGRANRR